jgi:1-deoxy-D-xylulose 5-phosphate reductoisomerase
VAVYDFLDGQISFTDIPDIVEAALNEHVPSTSSDVESIWSADRWARDYVEARHVARR